MLTFMLEGSINSETNSWEAFYHPLWVPFVHGLAHLIIPGYKGLKGFQGIFDPGSLIFLLLNLESSKRKSRPSRGKQIESIMKNMSEIVFGWIIYSVLKTRNNEGGKAMSFVRSMLF